MRPASIAKALISAGAVGVLLGAVTACAAARAAGDHAAQGGGAIGGGVLFYVSSIALGAAGWAAAGIAGLGGWIGSWFFTPKAAPGAPPAGTPWGGLVMMVLAVLALRAWRRYPDMARHFLNLVKTAAMGIIGLRTPPSTPSN